MVVALALYIERYDAILNMMPEFIRICEEDIREKRMQSRGIEINNGEINI